MKKISVLLVLLMGAVFVFAQDATGVSETPAGAGTEADGGSSSADPYEFIVYSETRDNATIDLAFNELTGALRVTYTLTNYTFNEGGALFTIGKSVSAFARSKGYLKYRIYPADDSISFSDNGRTAVMKRFYILYDKSGL